MRHSLMNDVVFKIVFGSKQNEPILGALLNAILGLSGLDRIQDLHITNPYGEKKHVENRGIILDIKARDGLGRQYNIEVQVSQEPCYVKRSLYYLTSLFSEQLVQADSFDSIQRTVGISILDYSLFPDLKDLHSTYRFYDVAHARELSDILEIHYLELSKFDQDKLRGERTPLEKWLHILKFGEMYERGLEPIPDQLIAEEGIVMALNEMKRAYADDEVREMIGARLKAQHIEATRKKHYEAIEQRAREVARDLQQNEASLQQTVATLQQTVATLQQTETTLQQTETTLQQTETTLQQTETTLQQTERRAEEAEQEAERALERERLAESARREMETKMAELQLEIHRLRGL